MTKCIHCGLTLADPPNGEELSGLPATALAQATREGTSAPITPCANTKATTPPYRAEVIDNAVLALAGGIKV